MRRQADTVWFRSFLEFDTADTIRRTRQPILILHGSRDRHVAPHHAERLAKLARSRRRDVTVEQITLDGLDHMLVETAPETVSDYGDLQEQLVAPSLVNALTNWLQQVP